MRVSPIRPWLTSTSPSRRRLKLSMTSHANCLPPTKAPRCASSEARCTVGCSGTDTAPRPVEMDCHFESICESCTFFVTTLEFRPTLQAQRDDAERKGQVGRQRIFDGLLQRLETQTG